jgi:hypothetical protein
MRVMYRSVCTVAALLVIGGPVAAQERRPRPLDESIERTAEAVAQAIERNVEQWAEDFERNAEKWAEQFERHAEKLAALIEARVGAAGQDSEAARRRREIQREAEQRRREIQREAEERRREARREAEERRREAQRQRSAQQRGNVRDWAEATEQFSRTVRLGRSGIVDIGNIAGDITITGGGGDDVRIDAIKRMRNPSEPQARTLLQELRIDVTERAGRVEIRTQHPRARTSFGEVTYTLAVPAGIDVVVKTFSGNLRVSNIRGELRAETVSGDVVVGAASRIQLAKTVSGNVEITGAEGDIVGESVSGDVILRGARGRSARLNTVSGDVRLFDADLDRANVRSINGDVEYNGRLARGGRYDLNTHSGDVRITPAGNTGFEVEANTFNGDIVSEYALKLTQQSNASGPRSVNRQVRGSFGDGGAVIALRSFNGDITIVKR